MSNRITMLAFFVILLLGGKIVYDAKFASREMGITVKRLERQIASERNQISLLKAEWALLSSPAHIDELVKTLINELALHPLKASQIYTMADFRRNASQSAMIHKTEQPRGKVLVDEDITQILQALKE